MTTNSTNEYYNIRLVIKVIKALDDIALDREFTISSMTEIITPETFTTYESKLLRARIRGVFYSLVDCDVIYVHDCRLGENNLGINYYKKVSDEF